jgi:resuscitation-promoting factor RpfB
MQLKIKFLNHFNRASNKSRVHIYKRPYLVPLMGLVVGLIIVGVITLSKSDHELRPVDSHIVYLFDSGQRQTLDTHSKTVGELVKKLPLKLIPQDVVEPSLDTEIVEDNFRINIYRARPVTVVDNGLKTVAITAQKSPRVAAQDAGINVYPEDKADFAQGSLRENTIGEEVILTRATPVALTLYGTPLTVRTHSKTVGDLLKEKNVKLQKDDTLTPGLETPINPSLQITLVRNGTQVLTIQEDIPAPTQYVSDSTLSLGATAIRQAGVAGKRAVTYHIVTENGKETSRMVLQSTIIQAAVPQIVARGITVAVAGDKESLMAAAGISSGDFGYVNFIISHESGWRTTAQNSSSGAYGLCQALPGGKMASAGADWATNPITQLRWCNGYAQGRYGSWAAAYNFWISRHYW